MPFRGPKLFDRLILGVGADTRPRITRIDPPAARLEGGTSVTISGFEFVTDGYGVVPAVYFDGVIGENVVIVDRNTITCDTPVVDESYLGMQDVHVETVFGRATLPLGFQFYTTRITDITPRFGVIAGGETVLIKGYNFVTGSFVLFDGLAGTVTFIDSETLSVVTPAHAAGFVNVTVQDPDGNVSNFIGGYQYTLLLRTNSFRRQPGITINDTLGDAPNTMSVVLDGGTALPVVGEEIEYLDEEDDDRLLFRGIVQSVAQDYEGQRDQLVFRVHAADFTFILNKYRPFGTYTLVSASSIVRDLLRKFAPDFTADHVQSNLARISINFDGSRTFSQCLSDMAQMIGGGHWYVDYDRDVHFFHIVPPNMPEFTGATSTVSALLTAMTVAEGSAIGSTTGFDPGWYIFRRTDVYDNNAESALGVMSNPVFLDGTKKIVFSNVAVGTPAGSLNVSKRRIYVNRLLGPKVTYNTVTYSVNPAMTPLIGTQSSGPGSLFYAYAYTYIGENGGESLPSPIRGVQRAPIIGEPFGPGAPTYIGSGDVIVPAVWPIGVVGMKLYRTTGSLSVATVQAGTLHYIKDVVANERVRDRIRDADLSSQAPPSNGNATYQRTLSNVSEGTTLLDQPERFLQVEDNVTTGFTIDAGQTTSGGPLNPTVASVVNIPGTEPIPKKSASGRPKGPDAAPTATARFAAGAVGGTAGACALRTGFLYRDGTVSYASPSSPLIQYAASSEGLGFAGYDLAGIAIGPTVNGVECIARFVYIVVNGFDWTLASGFRVIADNTTTSTTFRTTELTTAFAVGQDSLVGRPNKPVLVGGPEALTIDPDPIPLWPNPDGPFLEDADPPDDIDDDNEELLRDPPISVSWDISQVRNRIYVKGRGSVATEATAIGSSTIRVADGNAYSPSGGQVLIGDNMDHVLRYNTVTGEEAGYILNLAEPVRVAIRSGDSIVNFLQVDNEESQKNLAKIELDRDGRVTDGVHEYTVIDSSLRSSFQMHMRAFAEVEVFSNPIVQVRYGTRDPLTRSGKTVHIELTEPPISGDFLIQQVTIDQIHDESDDLEPRYIVTASSVRFELNDLLLKILDQDRGLAMSTGGGGSGGSVPVVGLPATIEETVLEGVQSGVIQFVEFVLTDKAAIDAIFETPLVVVEGVVDYVAWPILLAARSDLTVGWGGLNADLVCQWDGIGSPNQLMTVSSLLVNTNGVTRFDNQPNIAGINDGTADPTNRDLIVTWGGNTSPPATGTHKLYIGVAYVLLPMNVFT